MHHLGVEHGIRVRDDGKFAICEAVEDCPRPREIDLAQAAIVRSNDQTNRRCALASRSQYLRKRFERTEAKEAQLCSKRANARHHFAFKPDSQTLVRRAGACVEISSQGYSPPSPESALRSLDPFDEFGGLDSNGIGHFQQLDHIEPTFASFVFGNERLRASQPGCEVCLGQPRLFSRFNEERS